MSARARTCCTGRQDRSRARPRARRGLSMARWLDAAAARALRVADTRASAPPALGAPSRERGLPQADVDAGRVPTSACSTASTWSRVSPGVALGEPVPRAAAARGVAGRRRHRALRARRCRRAQRKVRRDHRHQRQEHGDRARRRDVPRAAGVDCEVAGNIGLPVLDALMAREDARSAARGVGARAVELPARDDRRRSRPTRRRCSTSREDHLDRYDEHGRLRRGQGAHLPRRGRAGAQPRRRAGRRHGAAPAARVVTFGLDAPRRRRGLGADRRATARLWLAQRRDAAARRVASCASTGLHNAANALAALALCARRRRRRTRRCSQALREFRGPAAPRRAGRPRSRGVALLRRLQGHQRRRDGGRARAACAQRACVLIAGGDGKGQDFSPLAAAVAARMRARWC